VVKPKMERTVLKASLYQVLIGVFRVVLTNVRLIFGRVARKDLSIGIGGLSQLA